MKYITFFIVWLTLGKLYERPLTDPYFYICGAFVLIMGFLFDYMQGKKRD